ncbi:hypothetical protein KX928_15725 [Roseobacter sp. YSTF-M11]|uniref:Uncharacterized protein n=1 Tax=Roseobacter insulae TaxID=2859783 RepID=A0A9X1FY94_9RHOB|nr:hypothetical protein [Roseobacter insulae]MBW4709240.1 hypothetical protein [Roseobacter insulae]
MQHATRNLKDGHTTKNAAPRDRSMLIELLHQSEDLAVFDVAWIIDRFDQHEVRS